MPGDTIGTSRDAGSETEEGASTEPEATRKARSRSRAGAGGADTSPHGPLSPET